MLLILYNSLEHLLRHFALLFVLLLVTIPGLFSGLGPYVTSKWPTYPCLSQGLFVRFITNFFLSLLSTVTTC